MSAISARRCTISCSRGRTAGLSCCRIDDTDRERSTAEFDQAIRDDLDWIGPRPRPSRAPVGALRSLRARVRPAEGRPAASMPVTKRPKSSICAARCCSGAACRRSMSASLRVSRLPEAARRTGAFGSTMMRRSPGPTSSAASRSSTLSCSADPVVRREDGSWLYLLPSVIDDVDLGITHIVRGEDHVSNSADANPDVRGAGREAAALRS